MEEAYPKDDEKNLFGMEGIIRTLTETADLPLEDTLARLFDASDEFTQGSGRNDDTSVLILERRA